MPPDILPAIFFGQSDERAAGQRDHYLPLLYVIGARQRDDETAFPVEGVDGGSISRLTVQVSPRSAAPRVFTR